MKKTLFFLLSLMPVLSFAQPAFITALYPPQHGLNIPADAEIRIGFQKTIEPASICDSAIYIYSDITGLHKWDYLLKNNGRDLYLYPKHWWGVGDVPFNAGERVTVTLTTRLRYAEGSQFEGFSWHYTVAVRQNYGGNFTPQATFGGPYHWLCLDVNGDRFPDVILADNVRDKLSIFLNNGEGELVYSHQSPMSTGSFSSQQSFDFDRNGTIDISMSNRWIQLNDGKANFDETQVFPEQAIYNKVYDFNNDGLFDLVSRTITEDLQIKPELFFMRSTNGIAFADTHTISNLPFIPDFFQSGESYDLNNDGTIDFIMKGKTSNSPEYKGFLSILIDNDESPTVFQLQQFNISTSSNRFYGNDLNSDGWLDYVFFGTYYEAYASIDQTLVYLNDTTGYLNLYGDPIPSGQQGASGDIDGDADIDLFVTRSKVISVMPAIVETHYKLAMNRGNGEFVWSDSTLLPGDDSGFGYQRLIDLDLDGDLDVLISGPSGQMAIANESYGTSVVDLHIKNTEHASVNIVNFPNTLNAYTMIEIKGKKQSLQNGFLKIFDIHGRRIKRWRLPGQDEINFQIYWDGKNEHGHNVASGIYLLQACFGDQIKHKKIALVR